jgi:aspartate kinase
MALIVQKYGGTSVANCDKIRNVARRVLKQVRAGHRMVVVLSAMAGETNRFVDLARQMQRIPDPREMDVLLSSGEQVTVALFAMAVKDEGSEAISLLGDQVRIITDKLHTKARIKNIDTTLINRHLEAGKVVVVAGFQGVTEDDDITTLGRGGSDTTAVALAAALKADTCEIFTDVEGVYTTDPNVCGSARKSRGSVMMRCWNWPVSEPSPGYPLGRFGQKIQGARPCPVNLYRNRRHMGCGGG